METKSYYRPDIDGLRAFAVVAVILFHLNIQGWTGGFVGVDVFFVISGYLITSIIIREIANNSFSLLNFWERRIRRIIPPMVVVIFATFITSYFITLYPLDFKAFGLTMIAQAMFLANMFFMRQSSYFNASADTIPLLHTWSLAVEEQFYIIFPLILLTIFYIAKKYLLQTLITFAVLSLSLSIYFVNVEPNHSFIIPFLPHVWGGATNLSAGFYFLPARAWELLFGAIIAVSGFQIRSSTNANLLSTVGFIGLITSFFVLNGTMSFPGYAALLPTLSTAAIIVANTKTETFVFNFLSFPIFVWTGLISYSLYLWHWPIIVLTKQIWIGGLPSYWTAFVVTLTFVLSFLSYYLIETPFRKKKVFPKRIGLFISALVSLIILLSIGIYIYTNDGISKRAPESAQAIAIASIDSNPRYEECFKNNLKQIQILSGGDPCFLGNTTDTDSKVDFVLWGDSQADSLMPIFDELAKEYEVKGSFFAIGGCAPVIYEQTISQNEICTQMKDATLNYITQNNIKNIFLVADWLDNFTTYPEGTNVPLEEALRNSYKTLPNDVQIFIVQTVPRHTTYDVRENFYKSIHSTQTLKELSYDKHYTFSKTEREALTKMALENDNVTILDPADILCSEGSVCIFDVDGRILYKDDSHVNTYGSKILQPLFIDIFSAL